MAEVMLHIGGYNYQVSCDEGEIEALGILGNIVNEQIESARLMVGGLSEERQLLFAAILLAEKLHMAQDASPADAPTGQDAENAHAAVIDSLTQRVTALAQRLEQRN